MAKKTYYRINQLYDVGDIVYEMKTGSVGEIIEIYNAKLTPIPIRVRWIFGQSVENYSLYGRWAGYSLLLISSKN